MTDTSSKPTTKNALNTMGFPKQILVGAIAREEKNTLINHLEARDSDVEFFDNTEDLEECFRPSILGGLAEAILNEGVILRRLKSEIEQGRTVFASHIISQDRAETLSAVLYESGASNICYFGEAVLKRLAPPDQKA